MIAANASPFRIALAGLLALAAAMGVGRFMLTPALPFMSAAIPLSPAQSGFIASANFAGYLIGALAASSGKLRGSPQIWLLSALAFSAITTAAMAVSNALPLLALFRLIAGLASAFVLVFASGIILERLSSVGDRSTALTTLYFSGVGGGVTASAVLSGALTYTLPNFPHLWRAIWLCGGVLSLASLIAVAWLSPPASKNSSISETPAAQTPIAVDAHAYSPLYRLAIAYGLFGFGYVITATFITSIMRSSADLRPYEALIWGCVGLCATVSIWFWTQIAKLIGNSKAFALACVIEAVSVGASVTASSPAAMLLVSALFGGTFMGVTALGLIEARARAPEYPRRALAMMTACFGFGQMTGPTFAGLIAHWNGGFQAPSLIAAGALICAALTALPKQSNGADEPPPAPPR